MIYMMGDESELREKIAATLARYAPDAFADRDGYCLPCSAKFPSDFSAREQGGYRTLAAHILDDVRSIMSQHAVVQSTAATAEKKTDA